MMQEQQSFEKFISGFVAGEGYFFVNTGKYPTAHFGIKLQNKDAEILIKIRNYFECGNVRYQSWGGKHSVRFEICKIKDLTDKVVPFFERNSMSPARKQECFDKWKVIVKMIENKEHLNKENKEIINLLAKQINLNGGKSRGKE